MTTNWLNWKEAMAALRCSSSTLRRYCNERKLTRYKVGGRVLFKQEDIDLFMEKGRNR